MAAAFSYYRFAGGNKLDRTFIGYALYDESGQLARWYTNINRAVNRGDLPEDLRDEDFGGPPSDEDEMEHILDSNANAMSSIYWTDGAAVVPGYFDQFETWARGIADGVN